MAKEKSGPQVVAYGTTLLPTGINSSVSNTNLPAGWFTKVRKMRKDPTIALVRQLFFAPILASAWSYEVTEDTPEGAEDDIKKWMEPLKYELLRTSLVGCVDFGHQGYEKIFDITPDSSWRIRKLKPLLQDVTEIRVVEKTGAFDGLRQDDDVVLNVNESLLVNFDVEGTDWYGTPVMLNVEGAYDSWLAANTAAERYDTKVAGSHWVIHYPMGKSDYNGASKDNHEIAKIILAALEASGKIAVPSNVQDWIDTENLGNASAGEMNAWDIKLLEANASNASGFTDRLKYIDVLKVRGWGFPERSILEGQFGTKAEAGEHGDFAITQLELRHLSLAQQYNWHLVNQLLRLNYGAEAENTVCIKPQPIADKEKQYLRSIYQVLLSNPEVLIRELDNINLDSVRDQAGIPTLETEQELLSFLQQTAENLA